MIQMNFNIKFSSSSRSLTFQSFPSLGRPCLLSKIILIFLWHWNGNKPISQGGRSQINIQFKYSGICHTEFVVAKIKPSCANSYKLTGTLCPLIDFMWIPMEGVLVVWNFGGFHTFPPVCIKFIFYNSILKSPESYDFYGHITLHSSL